MQDPINTSPSFQPVNQSPEPAEADILALDDSSFTSKNMDNSSLKNQQRLDQEMMEKIEKLSRTEVQEIKRFDCGGSNLSIASS